MNDNCLNLHTLSYQLTINCSQFVTNCHALPYSNHFADVSKMVKANINKGIYRFANISKMFKTIIFNYGRFAIIKTEQKDNKNG